MADLSGLSPAEKAKRYRELAAEAVEHADAAATPHLKQSFRVMAAQWIQLADLVEAHGKIQTQNDIPGEGDGGARFAPPQRLATRSLRDHDDRD